MKILIKNGLVVDPAGRTCSKNDLLIENGKIGGLVSGVIEADQIIDATGKVVAPGFIDIHMHEEQLDPETGKLEKTITLAMLRMGVTTAIGGNCGINTMDPVRYLELMDRDGGPVNMGLLAGHTYLREAAGHADKYTGILPDELERLKYSTQEAVEAGCLGISYGIRYVPGISRHEMLEVAQCLKGSGKFVAAHVRDDAEQIFSAVRELSDIGRTLELPVQNSHVGSMGGFGQMERLLEELDRDRSQGLDIASDCYPYYAFSTRIGETTYDDGFLERYQTDYSVIEVCEGKYKGQRCTEEIFKELRAECPRTLTVCHVMRSDDVDFALLHPNVLLASDGLMDHGQGHPRAAGTFPRFLKEYVRSGKMSLYEAIRKMTTLPAQRLGLSSKGRLTPGADADVVIFDLDTVADRATFDQPLLPPEGIEWVLIGGEAAVENGQIKNDSLGRSIRR